MEKITYTIVGSFDEVTQAIDVARTENRFLSDVPNVTELIWSAQTEEIAEVEISIDPANPIQLEELALFTTEYPTITLSVSFDEQVQTLIAEGIQEQVV